MNGFMKRIQKLKKKLNIVGPLAVTLVYTDGTERTMNDDLALDELFTRGDIAEVRCAAEDLRSLLVAMLPGCNCGDDWDDDSSMVVDDDEAD